MAKRKNFNSEMWNMTKFLSKIIFCLPSTRSHFSVLKNEIFLFDEIKSRFCFTMKTSNIFSIFATTFLFSNSNSFSCFDFSSDSCYLDEPIYEDFPQCLDVETCQEYCIIYGKKFYFCFCFCFCFGLMKLIQCAVDLSQVQMLMR